MPGRVPDARRTPGPVLASPGLAAAGSPVGFGTRPGAGTQPADLQLPGGPVLDEELQGAAEPGRPLLPLPCTLHSAVGAGLPQRAGSDGLPLLAEGRASSYPTTASLECKNLKFLVTI